VNNLLKVIYVSKKCHCRDLNLRPTDPEADTLTTQPTRHIRNVWQSLPPSAIKTLVVSLVLSRLDYDNATFTGIPGYLLCRLQSVLNAAARVISEQPRLAHVRMKLANVHWIRAVKRIKFKLATPTLRCLQGSAPRCLSSHVT